MHMKAFSCTHVRASCALSNSGSEIWTLGTRTNHLLLRRLLGQTLSASAYTNVQSKMTAYVARKKRAAEATLL